MVDNGLRATQPLKNWKGHGVVTNFIQNGDRIAFQYRFVTVCNQTILPQVDVKVSRQQDWPCRVYKRVSSSFKKL